MKNARTKDFLRKTFPHLFLISRGVRLLYSKKSWLYQVGYVDSYLKRIPISQEGKYLPWMNYHVIDFLNERLNAGISLFEYGSGYSTVYWGSKVNKVTAVEHDYTWFKIVSEILPENVEIIHIELNDTGNYVNAAVNSGKKYDFIVIDGRERIACIKSAINALSEQGIILLDDSHKTKYQKGVEYLQNTGFKKLTFSGIKPGSMGSFSTSLFYRAQNCFDL